MSELTGCVICDLQDDDKPMIEIMDQLSPVILESFVNVAISETVISNLPLLFNWILQHYVFSGFVCYESTVPAIIANIKSNLLQ